MASFPGSNETRNDPFMMNFLGNVPPTRQSSRSPSRSPAYGRISTQAVGPSMAGPLTEFQGESWAEEARRGPGGYDVHVDPFMTGPARDLPVAPLQARPRDLPAAPLQVMPTHNVSEDPFILGTLRDLPLLPSPPRPAKLGYDVAADPFIMGDLRDLPLVPPPLLQEVRQNPFLTGLPPAKSTKVTRLSDLILLTLGPGDSTRTIIGRIILVMVPWFVFVLVTLMWLLLRHASYDVVVLFTSMIPLAFAYMIAFWYTSPPIHGPVSLLALGGLCLLAASAGVLAGVVGWQRHWEQIWWNQTGQSFSQTVTSASTPAMSRADAAVITFRNQISTFNGTAVDNQRSAGFKDGRTFCVAPILSPSSSDAAMPRVNFWAVGIDCCQEIGSFTCDAARTSDGGDAVVLLDHGYPCKSCNVKQFEKAILKAESTHGLVSAPGALFVRWVADADATRLGMTLSGVLYMFLCFLTAFWACYFAGTFAWYFGIGRVSSELTGETLEIHHEKVV